MDYNEMIIKFCNISNLSIDVLLKKLSQYRSSDRTIYDFFVWKSEFPNTDTDILLSQIGIEAYKYFWRDIPAKKVYSFKTNIFEQLKNDYFHSGEYQDVVVKWMKK